MRKGSDFQKGFFSNKFQSYMEKVNLQKWKDIFNIEYENVCNIFPEPVGSNGLMGPYNFETNIFLKFSLIIV